MPHENSFAMDQEAVASTHAIPEELAGEGRGLPPPRPECYGASGLHGAIRRR